jgi:hypothetical protein
MSQQSALLLLAQPARVINPAATDTIKVCVLIFILIAPDWFGCPDILFTFRAGGTAGPEFSPSTVVPRRRLGWLRRGCSHGMLPGYWCSC